MEPLICEPASQTTWSADAASAGSLDLLCETLQLFAAVVAADPVLDLRRRQLPIRLDDGALAVDPLRLDRVEPRGLHRQLGVRPSIAFPPCPSNNVVALPRSPPAGSEGDMPKTYRDWSTDQAYLFPPSPHD